MLSQRATPTDIAPMIVPAASMVDGLGRFGQLNAKNLNSWLDSPRWNGLQLGRARMEKENKSKALLRLAVRRCRCAHNGHGVQTPHKGVGGVRGVSTAGLSALLSSSRY